MSERTWVDFSILLPSGHMLRKHIIELIKLGIDKYLIEDVKHNSTAFDCINGTHDCINGTHTMFFTIHEVYYAQTDDFDVLLNELKLSHICTRGPITGISPEFTEWYNAETQEGHGAISHSGYPYIDPHNLLNYIKCNWVDKNDIIKYVTRRSRETCYATVQTPYSYIHEQTILKRYNDWINNR